MKPNAPAHLEALSPRQVADLRAFEVLLRERGLAAGVVARDDAPRLWERHILDSLRALPCLPPRAISLLDLGSGGGLPGIPLAVARPDLTVQLVERRGRRVAFLEFAVERLGLANASVVPRSVEDVTTKVEGCLARALAPAERSWALAAPRLVRSGFLLYWAGRRWKRPDAQALAAAGVVAETCSPPSGVGEGSVVKMARQVAPPDRRDP